MGVCLRGCDDVKAGQSRPGEGRGGEVAIGISSVSSYVFTLLNSQRLARV